MTWLFLTFSLLSVQRESVLMERTRQFQTNVESPSPFFTVQNTQRHVFNFNSDNMYHIMNGVMPSISCSLVNVLSIMNKMYQLQSYAYALKPDLVMITESWTRGDISDSE